MSNDLFPIAILAGGLATRLHPLTHTLPKVLVEINGEPFISHQLRLLKKNKITKVVMCVGHLGDQIVDFVGDGSQFGLDVTYSFDGATSLGTAGAIKRAIPLLGESFFVLYGDSYLACPFLAVQKAFVASNKIALMTVFGNNQQWDKSNVEFDNGHILNHDKKRHTERMNFIDYGLGIFSKNAFTHLIDGQSNGLDQLYQELLKQQQLAAFEIKERFYEVGSFAGIKELEFYLSHQKISPFAI